MNTESWLILVIGLFVSLELFYVKKRLDHNLRTEFDKQIELFKQAFQRELASLQALYSYKQLAIKSFFEQTCALIDDFWETSRPVVLPGNGSRPAPASPREN